MQALINLASALSDVGLPPLQIQNRKKVLLYPEILVICKSKSLQPWGHFNNVNQVLFHLQDKDTEMVMLLSSLKKNQ